MNSLTDLKKADEPLVADASLPARVRRDPALLHELLEQAAQDVRGGYIDLVARRGDREWGTE